MKNTVKENIDFKIFFSYKDATSFFGIIEGRKTSEI